MEDIQHEYVEVNGLKLHVAEIGRGSSPAIVFLHGFPEIWYSWRHQMIAVAKAGFRAIAPDYRGYGLSDQPLEPEKATYADLISDLQALLQALSIPKAFLVAKDFGAMVAQQFTLVHPDKVSGIVTLGIPFLAPGDPAKFLDFVPEGFYIARWQEPGKAEADFGRFDAKTVVRTIYILFSRSDLPIASEKQQIMDMVDESTPLPPWFSDENLAVYGSLYAKSGFQTALKVPYRSIGEEIRIPNSKVEAPVLFIMGEKDYFFKFPGMHDYIRNEEAKKFVPNMETRYVPEGGHFVQEQFPQQVNDMLVSFINKYK